MTERHGGFLVTLNAAMRPEDSETIRQAIEMIRGVNDVQPVPTGGSLAQRNTIILRDAQWRSRLAGVAREMTEVSPDGTG